MALGRDEGTAFDYPSHCAIVGIFFKCLNTGRPSCTTKAGFFAKSHDPIYTGESHCPAAITLTLLCLKLNVHQNHLEGLLKNKSLGSEFLAQ